MFWDNFVSFCASNGESPNAVAAKLKLSSGSVTSWKGGTIPRETTLKKLADYFGITVDVLLYGQKEKPAAKSEGLSEVKIEFMDAVKQMSDDRVLQLMYVLGLKKENPAE